MSGHEIAAILPESRSMRSRSEDVLCYYMSFLSFVLFAYFWKKSPWFNLGIFRFYFIHNHENPWFMFAWEKNEKKLFPKGKKNRVGTMPWSHVHNLSWIEVKRYAYFYFCFSGGDFICYVQNLVWPKYCGLKEVCDRTWNGTHYYSGRPGPRKNFQLHCEYSCHPYHICEYPQKPIRDSWYHR